jgi:hypothetical protein
MKQTQYDEYDGDNEQSMDPTAGLWEARAYVPTEKAESLRITRTMTIIQISDIRFLLLR